MTTLGAPFFVHAPEALVRRTSTSVIALATAPEPVVLRDTALVLWHLFEEPQRVQAAAADLAATFDMPTDQARREIEPFVDELQRLGLLVPCSVEANDRA